MKKSILFLSVILIAGSLCFSSCEEVNDDFDNVVFENFEKKSVAETENKPRARSKATLAKTKM